jgi:hypothetical protein
MVKDLLVDLPIEGDHPMVAEIMEDFPMEEDPLGTNLWW